MSQRPGGTKGPTKRAAQGKAITLKALAEYLELSPTTVSLVMNRSPAAESIPAQTHERVFAAARKLNYRPNYMARSLRSQRSSTIGVLVPEISEGYAAGILSGIEDHLMQEGYFYLVASHRAREEQLEEYLRLLEERLVEGHILVATPIARPMDLPTVVIAGHTALPGVTNLVIDHDIAADLALGHLQELGHERIAFFKGHPNSADTEDRWRAVQQSARQLGLTIDPRLTLQLSGDPGGEVFSPEEGYQEGYVFGRKLLDTGVPFTTLFAFNDVSAIGAMRAFLDAGLRIPDDVSVVGFDDIQSAAFHNPSLTTVRQPLREMGQLAGQILLQRLAGDESYPDRVSVAPQLMVRASTAPARPAVLGRRAGRPQRMARPR